MAMNGSDRKNPCLFVGLAGETAPGYEMHSGLFRLDPGNGGWESAAAGLPDAPEVRALTPHPSRLNTIYAGTQDGPYLSEDQGDFWTQVSGVESGLPVWSILFAPNDPTTMYAGGEDASVHSSANGGQTWTRLITDMRFPEITMRPRANPARRVLMMGASPFNPQVLYGAIEVGGVMRSMDGGRQWENLSHGMYQTDQAVDTHGILASSVSPDLVFSITGAGLFRSPDGGNHWGHVPLTPLDVTGRLYTRAIQEDPTDPNIIWVGAGNGFDGGLGGLYKSEDGGDNWNPVNMGVQLPSSIFCIAFDHSNPSRMACASYRGQVYISEDSGSSWEESPLPDGATHVYALAWA